MVPPAKYHVRQFGDGTGGQVYFPRIVSRNCSLKRDQKRGVSHEIIPLCDALRVEVHIDVFKCSYRISRRNVVLMIETVGTVSSCPYSGRLGLLCTRINHDLAVLVEFDEIFHISRSWNKTNLDEDSLTRDLFVLFVSQIFVDDTCDKLVTLDLDQLGVRNTVHFRICEYFLNCHRVCPIVSPTLKESNTFCIGE